jgi:8-oxo-dGTP pyrophosphatase MutT (NUDIX family)
MKIRHTVQAVIIDEKRNKTLLIKKFDFVKMKFFWRLVKGGIKKNEQDKQALRREIEEEAGLKNIKIFNKINNYQYLVGPVINKVSIYLVKANSKEKRSFNFGRYKEGIIYSSWVDKNKAVKMLYWKNEKQAVKLLL